MPLHFNIQTPPQVPVAVSHDLPPLAPRSVGPHPHRPVEVSQMHDSLQLLGSGAEDREPAEHSHPLRQHALQRADDGALSTRPFTTSDIVGSDVWHRSPPAAVVVSLVKPTGTETESQTLNDAHSDISLFLDDSAEREDSAYLQRPASTRTRRPLEKLRRDSWTK